MRQSREFSTLLYEVIIKLFSEMVSVCNRNQLSQYRGLFTNTIKNPGRYVSVFSRLRVPGLSQKSAEMVYDQHVL